MQAELVELSLVAERNNIEMGVNIIKNNKMKRIMAIIMLVFIIFPAMTVNKTIYAATPSIEDQLQGWLNKTAQISTEKFCHFTYKKDGISYDANFLKIELPDAQDDFPRIAYRYSSSGAIEFVVQEKNDEGVIKEKPIRLNLYIEYEDENGKTVNLTVLRRTTANNFDVADSNEKLGYLVEVDPAIKRYANKSIHLSATIEDSDIAKDVEIISEDKDVNDYFKEIRQSEKEDGFFAKIFKWITSALDSVKNFLESLLNQVLLALADGIFSILCSAVGEPVTIDKVIFGKVGKLSINFWDGSSNGSPNSVMSIMKPVVNRWYNVLFLIAVIVYLVSLLVIGIKIALSSTGESKSKYKESFQAWVSGVMVLCLFPYVMKYTVKLNNLLVTMIREDIDETKQPVPTPTLTDDELEKMSASFGEDNFIASIKGSPFVPSEEGAKRDTMMYIRDLAGNLGKMSLTFVYYVMLGELIVLIIVYYKRVFMMAFLITIFPIVAMMYIIEKIMSGNSSTLRTWLKEYIVLVVTQAFHAAVYVVVVDAGVQAYIASDNWLFMLLCVIFLFKGEGILRSIFSMKSTSGAISDLAKAGMTAIGTAKAAGQIFKSDKKGNKEEKEQEEAEKNSKKPQVPSGSSSGSDSSGGGTSGDNANDGGDNDSNEDDNDSVPQEEEQPDGDGIAPGDANFTRAQNAVIAKALKQRQQARKGKGVTGKIGKLATVAGVGTGAILGMAAGLATGETKNAVAFTAGGVAAGKTLGKAVKVPLRGISNVYQGHKLKKSIRKGKMDSAFKDAGLDMSTLDSEKQRIYREALANLGGRTTSRGKLAGKLKMVRTLEKMTGKQNEEDE